jgi:hypothetical protein
MPGARLRARKGHVVIKYKHATKLSATFNNDARGALLLLITSEKIHHRGMKRAWKSMMHLFRKSPGEKKTDEADFQNSGAGTIHRIRPDGSVDVSIEVCLGPNNWNLRFDITRNVALFKRIGSVPLLEGSENNEEQVETSLDCCLYVQACGIQLENNPDPSLLHVGSGFTFRAISSEILDSEAPALSALKLQSDEGLDALQEGYNAVALEVCILPDLVRQCPCVTRIHSNRHRDTAQHSRHSAPPPENVFLFGSACRSHYDGQQRHHRTQSHKNQAQPRA